MLMNLLKVTHLSDQSWDANSGRSNFKAHVLPTLQASLEASLEASPTPNKPQY